MNREAEFNTQDIIEVSQGTVARLIELAKAAPRRRYRLCLHHSPELLVNEMVIVGTNDTYVRPHRHPAGKDESYYVMEGEMVVFIFDDSGKVVRHVEMGEYRSGRTVLYRLSASIYHLPVPLTDWVVYHEVYTGPFRKEQDVEYASWSPPETDTAAVRTYMEGLMKTRKKAGGN